MVIGTIQNPLLKTDVPDPSIVRAGNAYYMVSTTMYFCPVAPIMKSYDLVNWKIVSYCADIIEDIPNFRLETENAELIGDYGRGQWASSIRYFDERFYVIFRNNTTGKSYLFTSQNAENGSWEQLAEINDGFHDPSLFLDEESNRVYVFHGSGAIRITELNRDLKSIKQGGTDKVLIKDVGGNTLSEGTHAYKLNGYYYLFIIRWPFDGGRRMVVCYRSADIEGPYEERIVLNNTFPGGGGIAQGGIIDTPCGNWYGFFFQDRNAVGRVPFLIPMTWSEDLWPVFGPDSSADLAGSVPASFEKELAVDYESELFVSDEFENDKLHLAWQWNHNPDNDNWSLTERPGYLRLRTGRLSKTIYHARNTLTQRTYEPRCTATAALETVSMKDGDIAGLAVLQALSGFIGIEQDGGQKFIVMYTGDNDSTDYRGQNAAVTRRAKIKFDGSRIYLKAECRFQGVTQNEERAYFYYSLDGENYIQIASDVNVNLYFSLQHFTGYRFALFNYATKETGGYVDFDYYRIGE